MEELEKLFKALLPILVFVIIGVLSQQRKKKPAKRPVQKSPQLPPRETPWQRQAPAPVPAPQTPVAQPQPKPSLQKTLEEMFGELGIEMEGTSPESVPLEVEPEEPAKESKPPVRNSTYKAESGKPLVNSAPHAKFADQEYLPPDASVATAIRSEIGSIKTSADVEKPLMTELTELQRAVVWSEILKRPV